MLRRRCKRMADELAIGGPGTTSVVTTELVDQSLRLRALAGELRHCSRRLLALDRRVPGGALTEVDAPLSALRAEAAIERASAAIDRAIADSSLLARGLANAAGGYELAEHFADRLSQEVSARAAAAVGALSPLLLALSLPVLLMAGGIGLSAFLALPDGRREQAVQSLGDALHLASAPLSDPALVELVRMTVMSADDFAGGLLRLPPELVRLLGDEGLGILGVDTSAAVITGAALGAGVVKETPVVVRAVATSEAAPVTGIRDRAERIPEGPAQIRIDRHSSPGVPDRFEVYLAGTAELGTSAGPEPWDMTSNLVALSGGSSGSFRAAVAAMQQAGIGPDSPIVLTGYSQGGLIAAQLAASGRYSVDGLVTFGAPAGPVAVPGGIPYLAVEHSDDLVPALGGAFASSEPTLVRRRCFDGPPPPSEFALPAHRLSTYADTAGLIDSSRNIRLGSLLEHLEPPAASTVVSTLYLAERTPPSGS